jgi:hypothetical protein
VPVEGGGNTKECIDVRQPLELLRRQVDADHVGERVLVPSAPAHMSSDAGFGRALPAGKGWRPQASLLVRATIEEVEMQVASKYTATVTAPSAALAARFLGALSLLAVGAVHLQQYEYLYSAIPTIGTLFMLNFVGATVMGLGLLAPLERLLGRFGDAAVGLFALGGAVQAATAFVFLLVSERTPLFGFMEPGYDPPALMASRVAELVTVGLLGSFLIARFVSRSSA